jgi:hypothetical protein
MRSYPRLTAVFAIVLLLGLVSTVRLDACPFCINGRWRPAASTTSTTRSSKFVCSAHVRRYYIAAEPVAWSYAPLDYDPVTNKPLPSPWDTNPL